MLDFLVNFLAELIANYGFIGLFLASFLGSTIFFPFAVELFIPLFTFYLKNPYLVVFLLTIGSSLGTCVNYALGFLGAKAIKKRVSKEHLEQARKLTNKYGWPGLLLIIALPFPGLPVDPITIFPGIARMNFHEFIVVVFLGKLIKYSLFVGLFNSLFQLF